MLTATQQNEIVQMAKNFSRQKEKARTLARGGQMTPKMRAELLKRAEDKLREYLKEL
jgi:hypothetical protein